MLQPPSEYAAASNDFVVLYYLHKSAWVCASLDADIHIIDEREEFDMEWKQMTRHYQNQGMLLGNTKDLLRLQRILRMWSSPQKNAAAKQKARIAMKKSVSCNPKGETRFVLLAFFT